MFWSAFVVLHQICIPLIIFALCPRSFIFFYPMLQRYVHTYSFAFSEQVQQVVIQMTCTQENSICHHSWNLLSWCSWQILMVGDYMVLSNRKKEKQVGGEMKWQVQIFSTLFKVETIAFFVQYPLWSYLPGQHVLLFNVLKMIAILQNPKPEEDGWFIKVETPWRQYNHTWKHAIQRIYVATGATASSKVATPGKTLPSSTPNLHHLLLRCGSSCLPHQPSLMQPLNLFHQ
jgi:hypothetical protein